MGKNNKARRAAKARQRARQRAQGGPRRRPEPQHDAGPVFSEAERAELAWLTAAGVGIGRRMADQETGLAQLRRLAQPIVWSVGERLLLDHTAGAANNYKELWALVVLAHWARRHL